MRILIGGPGAQLRSDSANECDGRWLLPLSSGGHSVTSADQPASESALSNGRAHAVCVIADLQRVSRIARVLAWCLNRDGLSHDTP
jgi:hypothetical protein